MLKNKDTDQATKPQLPRSLKQKQMLWAYIDNNSNEGTIISLLEKTHISKPASILDNDATTRKIKMHFGLD